MLLHDIMSCPQSNAMSRARPYVLVPNIVLRERERERERDQFSRPARVSVITELGVRGQL